MTEGGHGGLHEGGHGGQHEGGQGGRHEGGHGGEVLDFSMTFMTGVRAGPGARAGDLEVGA